jgi:translation initiation factor IF-1
MFRVRLDDGREVRASLGSSLRHAIVRLIAGTPVLVALTPHDPHRARIVQLASKKS